MAPVQLLMKPSSGMCNLQCTYCFYRNVSQSRENLNYGLMSEKTLENITKKALAYAEGSCTFVYQGGEPTIIGLDFYKKAIELQNKYNTKGLIIYNAIQTNGYHLNNEWAAFFKKNHFLVGLSLDGIRRTHDNFRMNARGEGTFYEIIATAELFKKYQVDYNIVTVVNSVTAQQIDRIYTFYQKKGFEYLQFIPCLDPIGTMVDAKDYSLDADSYGKFMIKLFNLWFVDYMEGKLIHIREFENYIQLLAGYPAEACGMNGVCSIQNIIEADGTVYPCDFYVLDDYQLGNINEIEWNDISHNQKAVQFIETSKQHNEECLKCRYYMLCRGGCRRYREPYCGNSQKNKFCESYRMFFDATISRMVGIAERFR